MEQPASPATSRAAEAAFADGLHQALSENSDEPATAPAEATAAAEADADAAPLPAEVAAANAALREDIPTDGPPVTVLSPRSQRAAMIAILLPAIFGTSAHLCFVCLLLAKWSVLEPADGSGLLFSNFTAMHTGAPIGLSWYAVFAPAVVGELLAGACAAAALLLSAAPHRNARCIHLNSLCHAVLTGAFELLLARRLANEGGSWRLVFAPWYLAMATQIGLHYAKEPIGLHSNSHPAGGRRPGFPVSLSHILALVISFKLQNSLEYAHSSWASVLWPLWGVCSFVGMVLLLTICCGLPLVLRRASEVRGHVGCVFGCLVTLLVAVFLPAIVAAIRLAAWLDGDASISAISILGPYLTACSVGLIALLLSAAAALFCSGPRIGLRDPSAAGGADGDDSSSSMAELLSNLPAPSVLVRESSTLFRRVSSSTLDKYSQRHPKSGASGGASSLGRVTSSGDYLNEDEESGSSRLLPPASAADGGARSDTDSLMDDARLEEPLPPTAAAAASSAASSSSSSVPPPSQASTAASLAAAEEGRGELREICIEMGHPLAAAPTQPPVPGASTELAAGGPPAAAAGGGDASADASGAPSAAAADEEEGLDADHCWICMNGARDAVLLECGHGGICFPCATKCARQRPPICPMCRGRITRIVQLSGPEEHVDGEVVIKVN